MSIIQCQSGQAAYMYMNNQVHRALLRKGRRRERKRKKENHNNLNGLENIIQHTCSVGTHKGKGVVTTIRRSLSSVPDTAFLNSRLRWGHVIMPNLPKISLKHSQWTSHITGQGHSCYILFYCCATCGLS